ncbi:hypothetical protein PIB30_035257 [Stylosanthes scabra]|uniref:Uncharacterized protein n=1 Tax=Stylosanthes scabra TaxID=79078 RepID=A0ABU6VF82_9FABA|nr:hypothetical protein [Stylosanthes scabra]
MESTSNTNTKNKSGSFEGEKSSSSSSNSSGRVRLSEVVADCVKRWFRDTMKEAKAGDVNMQVLLAQMYSTGYGVPKDPQKSLADQSIKDSVFGLESW